MLISFSNYVLLKEARSDKIIVYHGTSPKRFQSIMSQGLIPNHPKRSFDKHGNLSWSSTSVKSLEGIYVTTNLRTALMSAGLGSHTSMKDGKLIVVAEIQPKTGFMDEDKLARFDQISNSEYVIANLYGALTIQPNQEFINQYYERFKEQLNNMLSELKQIHPNLIQRIEPLLRNLFQMVVNRQASYLDDWTFRKAKDYSPNIKQPDKSQAENDLIQAKKALTKTLKKLANPHNFSEDPVNFSSRIMQPIDFKGANQILAIVFEPPTNEPPEIWYGEVPKQFIQDWNSIVEEWKPKEK